MLIKPNEHSYGIDVSLMEELLKDRTTNKNIIWATDNYVNKGFNFNDQIIAEVLA